ncbi:hypothetical protein GCK72_019925 [Caenorhabditis remanei]|uniref:G-protein coupled receptors family 1 profile domain-containing protein n=1 Tax=Caenorhabditis remanei TaxID=31234 RepID=A0A6A5GG37_CAERE|nr:hypothetical protein GCK72_019925 [Caenorhabditis remanei]KAF1753369.1 hypothetical protein GCK72_019925 [Caenorhabditis remanei]
MRTSCINVIMIGMGIADIINVTYYLYVELYGIVQNNECINSLSYAYIFIYLCQMATYDMLRRDYAWLVVMMDFIRFLVIKNAMSAAFQKLAEPLFGLKAVIACTFLSVLISVYGYWHQYIDELSPWVPPTECQGYPANYSEPKYFPQVDLEYEENPNFGLKPFLYFDSCMKPVQYSQMSFESFIQSLSEIVADYKYILAIIAIIINMIHLLVLTRKSMCWNSVNVLMIGIAICDVLNLSFFVYDKVMSMRTKQLDWYASMIIHMFSISSESISMYQIELYDVTVYTAREILRRLSSWLDVLLALVRLLIITNSLNAKFDKLSKCWFGVLVILFSFLISTTISMLYWAQVSFYEVTPWVPKNECSDNSNPSDTLTTTASSPTKSYISIQILYVIDGALRIFPSLLLPTLTYLLIKELKNAANSRRRLSFTKTKDEQSETDHTTKMVILMAISCMTTEVPLGIVYVAQGIETSSTFQSLAANLNTILGIFMALNASSHCFICLSVSSQYRKSMREVFPCWNCILRRNVIAVKTLKNNGSSID